MVDTRIAASFSRQELNVLAEAIGKGVFPGCEADMLPSTEVKLALLNSLIARGTIGINEAMEWSISPSASILFAPVLSPVFTVTAEILGVNVAARFVWYVLEHTTIRQQFISSYRQTMTFESMATSELLEDIVLGLGISKAPAPTGGRENIAFPEIMESFGSSNQEDQLDPRMMGSLNWIREAHGWGTANKLGSLLSDVPDGVRLASSVTIGSGKSNAELEWVSWIQDEQGGRWLVQSENGHSRCVATDGSELVSLLSGAFESCVEMPGNADRAFPT